MKGITRKSNPTARACSSKSFFPKNGEGGFFSPTAVGKNPIFSPATVQPKLNIGQPDGQHDIYLNRGAYAPKSTQGERLSMFKSTQVNRQGGREMAQRSTVGNSSSNISLQRGNQTDPCALWEADAQSLTKVIAENFIEHTLKKSKTVAVSGKAICTSNKLSGECVYTLSNGKTIKVSFGKFHNKATVLYVDKNNKEWYCHYFYRCDNNNPKNPPVVFTKAYCELNITFD